jgi:SCY1-like protein 1
MLVVTFARSMKDPFPRARIAALMSLTATSPMLSKEDAAMKAVPALSPLLIDPERYASWGPLVVQEWSFRWQHAVLSVSSSWFRRDVRDQAFLCLRTFTSKLQQISETGQDPSAEEFQAKLASGSGGNSGAGAGASSTSSTGMLSWAISSLSSKIYGTSASGSSSSNGGTGHAPGLSSSVGGGGAGGGSASASLNAGGVPSSSSAASASALGTSMESSAERSNSASTQAPSAREDRDGWEDDDALAGSLVGLSQKAAAGSSLARGQKNNTWSDSEDASAEDGWEDFDFDPAAAKPASSLAPVVGSSSSRQRK